VSLCPWYVSAAAVRAWQKINPRAPVKFHDASDALLALAATIWRDRYAPPHGREPKRGPHGALVYEGSRAHGRIRLLVDPAERIEGGLRAIVDVLPRSTAERHRL
jgi:hypothetical protein